MENDLFKIAYDFLKEDQLIGLYLAYDIGDKLVCFGGNPNESYYGCRSVAIDRKSKKIEWFIIEMNETNEKRLEDAAEVEVPIQYAYK